MWGPYLGEELRKHDIYVTASRYEPCGMHHIEGAASGMPVLYHRDCGGINELCEKHGEMFVNFEEFKLKLEKVVADLDMYRNKINYSELNIEKCCNKYYQLIKRLNSNRSGGDV